MTDDERAEWLAQRRFGSSDAPLACGLKAFGRDRFYLYMEKAGYPVGRTVSKLMEIGTFLEPLIAKWYEEETGLQLFLPRYPEGRLVFVHPDYEFMTSTPDRCLGGGKPVELKYVSDWRGWGTPGTDEVAPNYLIQVMHQLAVGGQDEADIAAFGQGELRIYTVPRDEELIGIIIAHEKDLAERVIRRDPPEPDWTHPETPRLLNLLNWPDKSVEIEVKGDDAGQQFLDDVTIYQGNGLIASQLEKQRKEAQARIIAAMGHASAALLPDGRTVRRTVTAERFQQGHKVSAGVRMTISKPKGAFNYGEGQDGDATAE